MAIVYASAPAIKPLVVKIFPKLLLSDLYARTRGTYGSNSGKGWSKGGETTGSSHASGNQSRSQSNPLQPIHVDQSLEMNSAPIGHAVSCVDTDVEDRLVKGPHSLDGSEKNLVASS